MHSSTNTQSSALVTGTINHPDGDRCDIEYCQGCGQVFSPEIEGYWVGTEDIGPDATGGTASVFRADVEQQLGDEWEGFEQEDIGAWCGDCSWDLQRKRSTSEVTPHSTASQAANTGSDHP